jgi:hypothetical protein
VHGSAIKMRARVKKWKLHALVQAVLEEGG